MVDLKRREQREIAEILGRRANEIAGFLTEYRSKPDHYGSVELGLTREMDRLRTLAERVNPPKPEDDEDND